MNLELDQTPDRPPGASIGRFDLCPPGERVARLAAAHIERIEAGERISGEDQTRLDELVEYGFRNLRAGSQRNRSIKMTEKAFQDYYPE